MFLRSILLFLLIPAVSFAQKSDSLQLKYYVSVLSADSMEGRKPGTVGIEKASAFIASQFQKIGLTPYNSSGFYQEIYLKRGLFYSSTVIKVGAETFAYPSDFSIYTIPQNNNHPEFPKLVFGGFGIQDSESKYNDYLNLDVKGKLVLVKDGVPAGFKKSTYDFDVNRKIAIARKSGASGLIVLSNEKSGSKKSVSKKRKQVSELFDPYSADGFTSVIVHDGIRFEKTLKENPNQPLRFEFDQQPLMGKNVIGILSGSDPILKNEWIVVSAHYDHIGKSVGKAGADSIFNGALDNASGTAALIQCADQIIRSGVKPKRSVLFLATTAEEMGFYGAEGFLKSNLLPKSSIIANINMDILGFSVDPNSAPYLTLLGGEYSSLEKVFETNADKFHVRIMQNYFPSYFFRSDNIVFAKAGIPSLQPAVGIKPSQALHDFEIFEKYYHHVNDQLPEVPIRFGIMQKQVDVIASSIVEIANSNHKPVWKKELDDFESVKKWDYYGMGKMWLRQWFW